MKRSGAGLKAAPLRAGPHGPSKSTLYQNGRHCKPLPVQGVVSWGNRPALGVGTDLGGEMVKRRHTPEQLLTKLREAEAATAAGRTVAEASFAIGGMEQT